MAKENVTLIVEALRRIQLEGGSGNFCIFVADPKANYYIQFAGQPGDAVLYAEAVGNEFLKRRHRLGADQIQRLESLGWNPPYGTPNFHRQWRASDYEDRERIAHQVLETLAQVYAIPAERMLEVIVELA